MPILRTACNRDCPDACSILAHVEEGRVVRLQGDPAHPVTRGFLCYRTDQFLARQYGPERVTTPLVRRDGALRPATWDEALDLCASTLLRIRAESGPAAIFHYRSGGSLGIVKAVTDHLFRRFGPVTEKRGDICGGAGDAAQLADFGDEDSNDLHDLENARAVLVWGKNLHTSSPHLLPVLREAKRRGARVALVDPTHHKGASLADLYVQPRPGGDVALALGMARALFDDGLTHPDAAAWCDHLEAYRALASSRSVAAWAALADVPEAQLRALAHLYGRATPAAILVGWGMQRRRNGAAIVRCLDALGAVTGNVGVSGGGVSFYFKRRGAFDTSWKAATPPRTLCEPRFGQDILDARDPPVRAVWITAGNPVAMLPASDTTVEALRTRELVVVVDGFLTDTAREATVVLPHATMLEDDDLVGAYGHHWLGSVRPVVAPPEGVLTDLEITQRLAARLGLSDAVAGSPDAWKRRVLRAGGPTLEDIESGYVRSPFAPRVAFEGRRFATATGRVNLVHALPDEALDPPRPAGDFPLALHSFSTPRSQSAQWSPSEPDEALTATVHPDAAPGFTDGARVTLRSCIGALPATLRFDPAQRRDVVLVPKGGSRAKGRCANALVRAALTDDGEGAALYEEGVRIEPA